MVADIAHGNVGFADICFLVAFILAVLAAVAAAPRDSNQTSIWSMTLVSLAVAALGLGWLVL